jgi:hypothetical protein
MERRGWLIAVTAAAAVVGLGCVTHPSKSAPLRLVDAEAATETGPPTPTTKPEQGQARPGWLRRTLPGLYTMPWYSKVGFISVAGYLAYAFSRHHHDSSSGSGPVCPFPQQWNARDSMCTDKP